ncbi:coadhesin-like [Saccostrea echinata]|uniref:coadhesin-like n=1 Tax=Saccostrea echinata TaxID=191078 RepID=UPI002A805561|nr:coadhesin-like [Saccostrea echinata]
MWLCLNNLIAKSLETTNTCFNPNVNYKTGKKLGVSRIKRFRDIGPNSCYMECHRHGNCLSLNYNWRQLICNLLRQKPTEGMLLEDDEDFIYMEIPGITDQSEKKCGEVTCNYYSTCIHTLYSSVCIETECTERIPDLKNGKLVTRLRSPHTAIFGCNPGYTAVGSVNTIYCAPGGKWGSLSYSCMEPIHGSYSPWGGWTSCTKSCDTGSYTRSRACNNPAPKYGGNNCQGNSTETTDCNIQNCPIHGGYSAWGGWTSCTKSCDTGSRTRSRSCNNPAPMNGGNNCQGKSTETADCNIQDCSGSGKL